MTCRSETPFARSLFIKEEGTGKVPSLDRVQGNASIGGLANTKQELWKSAVPEFIKELYSKHF